MIQYLEYILKGIKPEPDSRSTLSDIFGKVYMHSPISIAQSLTPESLQEALVELEDRGYITYCSKGYSLTDKAREEFYSRVGIQFPEPETPKKKAPMITKQKIKLAVIIGVGLTLLGLSIGIGIRHGIIEGIVSFIVLGWLYDVRLDQQK